MSSSSRFSDKAIIAFDPKEFRFELGIEAALVEQWEEPPLHLIETAVKTRYEDAAKTHPLKHLLLCLDRLKPCWNAYRMNPRLPPVKVTVATAFPSLPGLEIGFDLVKNDRVFISLPPDPALLRGWHPSWIESHIHQRLASSELAGQVNPAQLKVLYARAAHFGERIEKQPLIILPRSNPLKFGKLYQILVSLSRLEVEVLIGDVLAFQSESLREKLYQELDGALWSLGPGEGRSPFYRHMNRSLGQSLDKAREQPYALGLQLPLVLSGGFFLREESAAPFLSDMKSSDLALELQDRRPQRPRTRLGSASHRTHEELLRRRGLIKRDASPSGDEGLTPGISYFPPLALTRGAAEASQDFLDFAKQARASYPPAQRELQALTFAIPAQLWEKYQGDVESFWRDFMATFGQSQGPNASLTLLCHHFPLSLPRMRAKPKAAVTKPGSHDAASWLPMIVREVIALPFVPGDPAAIASYLAPEVSAAAVSRALEGLVKGGLLEYDSYARRYVQKAKNLMTGDDKQMEKIKRFHEEISELAAAMVAAKDPETQSLAFRLPLARERFEEARGRIRRWIHEVLEQSNHETQADQIFQLTVQLFLNSEEETASTLPRAAS